MLNKIINVENARKQLGKLVEEASQKPVVLTLRGGQAAVLLSVERFEQLERLEAAVSARHLEESLEQLHRAVAESRVSPDAVAQAIAHAREER